jgi:hypothetical protein
MTAFNFRMHAGGACKPLLPLADNIIERDADVALWPLTTDIVLQPNISSWGKAEVACACSK